MSHSCYLCPIPCPYLATVCPMVPGYVPTCQACPTHVPCEGARGYAVSSFLSSHHKVTVYRACPSGAVRHLPFSGLRVNLYCPQLSLSTSRLSPDVVPCTRPCTHSTFGCQKIKAPLHSKNCVVRPGALGSLLQTLL